MDKQIKEALEGEAINLGLSVQIDPEIKYLSLDEVDYAHKWNIRREDKYEERISRKMAELMNDLHIRTPLMVAAIGDAPLRGTCGFIRDGALRRMRQEHPQIYKDHFEGKTPYRIVVCTEDERQRLMMDHGSEELLDEYELTLAVKKYVRLGRTEKEIAVLLSPLFYQLADHKSKREFNTRIAELREKGKSGKAHTVEELMLHYWRRRIQHYKRIVSAPPAALELHKRAIDGHPGAKRISMKEAEMLKECTNDADVQKLLLGNGNKEATPQVRGWGRAKCVEARKIIQSKYFALQMDVILGHEDAEKLIPAEEELVQIEAALGKNPEGFWKMVEKLS